ncbi:MAG: NTP pyrophosphatase (non-canonical NTP hydrolase) [Mariniblastus sp.]|jgi:NTP pyrophosphatase (non-canonical NTP hydrolase)
MICDKDRLETYPTQNKRPSEMPDSDSPLPSDDKTSVQDLRSLVLNFVEERDWKQFHSPKNLSMALAIEAAELMEHFQWISTDASRELDAEAKTAAGEELADVLCYALAIANELDLDVTSAMANKMVKNREKYPVDEFRGRYGKDDPNPAG